jgi:hypothetical protein
MNLVDNNGVVVTELQFRANNQFTSFPAVLTQEIVAEYGLNIVQDVAQPSAAPFNTISEGPPENVGGVWQQTWVQTPFTLSDAKAIQSAVLDSTCANLIVSGFTSSALGSPYTYPSKPTDQQNLLASYVLSLQSGLPAGWTTPFWCADANMNWAWVPHTATQIQQAGQDGMKNILALQSKNAALQAQLSKATDISEVQLVVWS